MKNKETLLLIVIVLIVGVLVGVLISKGGKGRGPSPQAPTAMPAQSPAADFMQEVKLLEGIVAKEPGNRNAWVELGNKYFDMNQPVKSVEAYDKALAIDGNDPNVLTDQGIMFRALGWYDRAITNFSKANALNPGHQQSLYNMGLVYLYDLQQMDKAREAWSRYMALNPTGPAADQVRKFLEGHAEMATGAAPKAPAK
jgi:tetratricopeptide (TPR) repeat protein